MALHCVYSTTSFSEALIKCANLRGDSDSVCAVAGQIAGAFYGFQAIPKVHKKKFTCFFFLREFEKYGCLTVLLGLDSNDTSVGPKVGYSNESVKIVQHGKSKI